MSKGFPWELYFIQQIRVNLRSATMFIPFSNWIYQQVCYKLPVDAIPVSKDILEDLRKQEEELQQKNINPFSIERVIDYQMQGSDQWISKYDRAFYTKYI